LGIGSNAVKCWTANCQTGVYIREHRINLPVYHGVLVIGIGLFISNYTDTQQQAMFIAWFFTVIFILMSGLFTPIESMPNWAQQVTLFNPIRYFVEIIRMVMLKGATFSDISRPFYNTLLCFYYKWICRFKL
jgi:ABC-type multidrug transport system permease subunit